jgi:hypothetical protein
MFFGESFSALSTWLNQIPEHEKLLYSLCMEVRKCNFDKQWQLASEFGECEYSPKIRQIFVTRSGEFGEY